MDLWPEFIYDETSPTCLRWAITVRSGFKQRRVLVDVGDVAGSVAGAYYEVKVSGRNHKVHRIVFEKLSGERLGSYHVDHVNGDSLDNKFTNLRKVTQTINARNCKRRDDNTSGITGVVLKRRREGDYWRANWNLLDGRERGRCFSVRKFGFDRARELAINFRASKIAELNQAGAGYTERHGN